MLWFAAGFKSVNPEAGCASAGALVSLESLRFMTIFGFNSDVKYADVVYHVESQARASDLLLQTLIFVKGQCVGKHAFTYAQMTLQPGFSEDAMHELLKAQHRTVVDALQQGHLESVLGAAGEVQDVGGGGLTLRWINPAEHSHGKQIIMRFQVLDSGQPVSGAEVVVGPCPPAGLETIAHALTDPSGNVEVVVPMTDALTQQAAALVCATHGAKSVTRKFRFKK